MTESEANPTHFSSTYPVMVLSRPEGFPDLDWLEVDQGPGYFTVPDGYVIRVRIKSIGDEDLAGLVQELEPVEALRFLDLSENRNVTNAGLARLKALPQITGLNLSSCSITSTGLRHLSSLPNLAYLNLSFCNRLTDAALKILEAQRNITYVDLQGCLSITTGGVSRVRRRDLTIYR